MDIGWVGGLRPNECYSQLKLKLELKLELIYIFSTTSPGGWSDKTKGILNSTQVEVEV